MKRINKIAIELNVSASTLIQELKKVSNKEFDMNSKLETKEIEFLTKTFQKDKEQKIEADKKKSSFYFDIDENFSFNEQEKKAFSEIFSNYEKKQNDIKEPKEKENRKFRVIPNSNKSEQDPYENFKFGGLSGEEAHTAYWNCD